MAKKAKAKKSSKKKAAKSRGSKRPKVSFPGMMGDGTEEQNLNQRGNPSARIKRKEVASAFGRKKRR